MVALIAWSCSTAAQSRNHTRFIKSFRLLLRPGGQVGRRGRADLLWRRGCYSERTETISECQDHSIQSPQRCKCPLWDEWWERGWLCGRFGHSFLCSVSRLVMAPWRLKAKRDRPWALSTMEYEKTSHSAQLFSDQLSADVFITCFSPHHRLFHVSLTKDTVLVLMCALCFLCGLCV